MTPAPASPLTGLLRALDERWWLRHGLFWLGRTGLMTALFLFGLHSTTDWRVALRDSLTLWPPLLLTTYSLLYGVLPALGPPARRGRFGLLFAGWLGLGLALTFAHRHYFFVPSHHGRASPFADYNLVFATGAHMPVLLTASVAACLKLYRQWRRQALATVQLAQANHRAELHLLQAQIHPHFLFNTLNNLYALTLRQADQAPVVVERLTRLLRFVVAQGDAPLVRLRDEVSLLRDYLALEQLRYGPRLRLEFRADALPPTARIAPLLLLPLVENAFKHGPAEQLGPARVRLTLAVAEGWFSCELTNSKSPGPTSPGRTWAAPAGIGLRNVRQRLALLYPGRHRFEVLAEDDTFTVRLALRLPGGPLAAPTPVLAAGGATTRRPLRPVGQPVGRLRARGAARPAPRVLQVAPLAGA